MVIFCTKCLLITITTTNCVILRRCVATCFSHYVVILRPFKYIKTKITIADIIYGVSLRSQYDPIRDVCKCSFRDDYVMA
jgi:hypothetical protein